MLNEKKTLTDLSTDRRCHGEQV